MVSLAKKVDLLPIQTFLACRTPLKWVEAALKQQAILLIDHAHCEKKAASTALSLIYRYPDFPILLTKLSRLAREELRHFEQVIKILSNKGITFCYLTPSRYASSMLKEASTKEPDKLVDTLLIAAFIEARSCERFAALINFLEPWLANFYQSLLQSEARHFENYLNLAKFFAKKDLTSRINFFRELEASLILSKDEVFRFHSGVVD